MSDQAARSGTREPQVWSVSNDLGGKVEVEWHEEANRFVLRIVSPDGDYCSTGLSIKQANEVREMLAYD